jgi:drug/metabolite transporter (DMT)-like permease
MGVLVLQERLGAVGWAGVVVALAAGALLGRSGGGPGGPVSRRAVLLAVVAAVTLGLSVVAVDSAPADAGMVPVLVEVLVGLALLLAALLVTRTRIVRGALRVALLAGVLAGAANACLMAALYRDALSVVAVLLGLYPLGTVLLARLVLHERLSGSQLTGVGLAVLGSVLLGL